MILCFDKLEKMNFIECSWILINCGFHRNQHNSGLALNVKMLYWWLLSVGQISCLHQKVHNSPEILSKPLKGSTEGLTWIILVMEKSNVRERYWV